MNEAKLTDSEFKDIYSKVPRLCLEVIILDQEKGVLLTKRAIEPAKGMWHTPGGTVLHKERLSEAAKRIAKKELGVDIEPEKELGVIEAIFPNNYHHDLSVAMLAKTPHHEFALDDQASEFAFFKELPDNMIPAQKKFLGKHLL